LARYNKSIPHPGASFEETNRGMLRLVAKTMGPLIKEVVFLGGTVLPFLLSSRFRQYVRIAKDVDCIVDLDSKQEIYLFEDELRERGFTKRRNGAVCQWTFQGVNIDVLPADPEILSFNNRWCREAMEYAQPITLEEDLTINAISPAYFLAVKFDAFYQRGRGYYLTSPDMYDVVLLMAGQPDIVVDVRDRTSEALKQYFSHELQKLLDHSDNLSQLIPTLFPENRDVQRQLPLVVSGIREIISMKPVAIA